MVNAYQLTIALALAAIPASAMSQTPPQQPAQPATAAPDPNEVICERQPQTGSRLISKKICMTRAQWADLRLQDRQEVERVQVQRGAKGE